MIELADVESRLALFTEGIAGRYYHIKATEEFAGRHFHLAPDRAAQTLDTIYLPSTLETVGSTGFRLLTLEQLGQREFGTFRFQIDEARRRIPALAAWPLPTTGTRQSDFTLLYRHVPVHWLLRDLFAHCERARIMARVMARYPGARRLLDTAAQRGGESIEAIVSIATLVTALGELVDGADRELLLALDVTGLLGPSLLPLDTLLLPTTDVYDSAAVALTIYELWTQQLTAIEPVSLNEDAGQSGTIDWLQRDAKLEDWEEALAAAESALMLEFLEGDHADAAQGDNLAGELRPDDVDLRALQTDRDNLSRRIDMERAAIRDALGAVRPLARSYRYDEWDYLNRRYLRHWCRLYEEQLVLEADVDISELLRVIAHHAPEVQRQLEHIRPLGFQRQRRVADGDELDIDALIEARQDVRAGVSPDERVYSRRERVQRDLCAVFLVDLSASTDDPINPPPPAAHPDPDDLTAQSIVNLRDPYDDVLAVNVETAPEAPERRIIDVQRESMLVMSAALEKLGDSYGIYGFSGYGRDCVEFFVAKETDEPFTRRTLQAIASMKPKRSTRMGPAIRHATEKLIASGNALKLLIILSDGFPQDSDYGPQRGEHEYGVQDTAAALKEAQAKGVEYFCVTVDKSGHDYLRRMCAESRYLILDEIEQLPEVLSGVYRTLAGR
ncbi:MAG: VWA domain-containing protein [Pseudomonadales bacterium]|nr:VWA domain-containing protein [Pseudomonadales bacterium]